MTEPGMADPEALPPYIAPVLNIVAEPPFRHEDTVLHALILDGDADALQTSVDAMFAPLGLRFQVATSAVLATALYVERAFGENGHYARFGWARETDVAFWALARDPGAGLVWIPLYMFVDSGIALIAGREIYGFPKQIAAIERDMATLDDDLSVDVRVEHFPPATDRIPAVTEVLMAIRRGPAAAGGPLDTLLDMTDFAMRFAQALGVDDMIGTLIPPFGGNGGVTVPMVFLKQFRDIVDPERACYREAVMVETQSVGNVSIRVAPDDWVVDLTTSASHPIADDLGIAASSAALAAFVIKQDFVVGAGAVLS